MAHMNGRSIRAVHIALLSVLAGAFRVVPWMAGHRITFDEGVFLASTDLARAGLVPFQDFFSSQGPLFIPMLRLGQIVSFGDPRGPRTTLLVSAVVIAVSSYSIFTRLTSSTRAFLLASLVALSGNVLLAAGPVQSDGLAFAFAISALALVLEPRLSIGRMVWMGLLIGAAISVKSLHVVPIIVTIAVYLASRMEWKPIGIIVLVAGGVATGLAAIYGFATVWDQYVIFHLAKDNSPDLLDNVVKTGVELFRNDLPIVVLAITAGIAPFLFRNSLTREKAIDESNRETLADWVVVFWLVSSVVVLLGFTTIYGGFARTLAFLIPPLLATIAPSGSIPIRVLLGIAAVGAIVQFAFFNIVPELEAEEIAASASIEAIPENRWFVSDDPGLGWAAGRLSHPATVDPSYARFQTGYLTSSDVAAALNDPETCILTATSGRFDSAGITPPIDYLPADTPGVSIRFGC